MQVSNEVTKCVLCGTKQEIERVTLEDSDYTQIYLDGRPANIDVDMLIKQVQKCQRCGYCAYDLAAPMPGAGDAMESESYQLGMSESPHNPGWIPFCKGVIEEKVEHYSAAGKDLLLSCWYFDEKGMKQEANQQRQRALGLLVAGRKRGQDYSTVPGMQSLALVDIFRRTGQFTMADAAITTAAREADNLPNREWIREVLTLQTAWLGIRDIEGHTLDEIPGRTKEKTSSSEKYKARNLPTPLPPAKAPTEPLEPPPPLVSPEAKTESSAPPTPVSAPAVTPSAAIAPAAVGAVGEAAAGIAAAAAGVIPAALGGAGALVAAASAPMSATTPQTTPTEEAEEEVDLSATVRIQAKDLAKFERKGRSDASPVKQIRSVDGHPKVPNPLLVKEAGKPGWSLQLPDGLKSKFVVIDASIGGPAEGVEISIFQEGKEVSHAVSNSKGTMDDLVRDLGKGEYELNIPINKGMVKELRIKFVYDPSQELMLLLANSGANLVAR